MFSKLIRLFRRYCDRHFVIELPGFPVVKAGGTQIGQIERFSLGKTSLRAEGWATAQQVGFGRPGQLRMERPNILRADVVAALDLQSEQRTGFNLAWFGEPTGVMLAFEEQNTSLQIMCPQAGRLKRWRAEVAIRVSFAKAFLRASPALARAFFFSNRQNISRAKRALGLEADQINHLLDPSFLKSPEDRDKVGVSEAKNTLIVPVYNAYDVLVTALERIVENTDMPWRMILVEDCSTDTRVRPFLRAWSRQQREAGCEITVIENCQNKGFIGSVNCAFREALRHRDHIVLINSDALVPPGWASRLLQPMLADPKVASVTPMSNDAEIFIAPQACHRSDMSEGQALAVDGALNRLLRHDRVELAPTGVGFCMAINARYLRRVPSFDTVFGKGYGEEVDWCQKVARLGGRHMGQPALFVEHRGGASFGSKEKAAAIARNNSIISKRYPKYDQAVQRFISEDPLRTARLIAGVAAIAAQKKPVPIYIAHSMGGGAEQFLQEKLKAHLDEGLGAIVLRVGGRFRWRLEVHSSLGSIFGDADDFSFVCALLEPAKRRHLIYSCAVGDRDPMTLPSLILALRTNNADSLTVLVHDYFLISPSYCLLGADDTYRGVPELGTTDPAHGIRSSGTSEFSHLEWRQSWGRFLKEAQNIICFSESSAAIMHSAYPFLEDLCEVIPHSVVPIEKVRRSSAKSGQVIGVLGDIGVQKGAALVQALAAHLPSGTMSGMVVVGRLDPRFEVGAACVETGAYVRSNIAQLAAQHRISCWLIPSIWPETFSYTTHEALMTDLPVFSFDIGAQGEAVKRASNGRPLPFTWKSNPSRILEQIEKELLHGADHPNQAQRLEAGGNRGFAA